MTTNYGVARDWADLAERDSKSGNGNMSQNGNGVLYSYSTPIGHAVKGADGKSWVYLLTSEGYSVTTKGKHLNPAHRATKYKAFTVPFLLLQGTYSGRSVAARLGGSIEEQHAANLTYFKQQIAAEVERLGRARTYTSTDHLHRLQDEEQRYRTAFNLWG